MTSPLTASTHSVRLILNTAVLLTAFTLVVRATGALKEILFARAYGVSGDTDAFVLAGTYAMFLPTIVGGAIGTALIAALAETKGSFRGAGLGNVTLGISVVACIVAMMMYALAPFVMASVFDQSGEALEKATLYARILSPLGATLLAASAMEALLNSAKQFYIAGLAGIAMPLAIIFAILFLADRWGVEAAAWGTVVGGIAEVLMVSARIYSQRREFFGNHARAAARVGWTFWKSAAILSLAGSISVAAPFVDQIFLSRLETGAVTSLNYASKVNSLLIGVFGTAFSAAIYPYLSDLAAQRDIRGLKRLTWRLSAVVLPVTGIAMVAVYALSYEIIELLFARGKFTAASVLEVGSIQRIFAFQLPLYVAGLLAMRVLNAAGASKFVLYVSCISLASTALLDWLFYQRLGAGGIALSAVLTSGVSLACVIAFIRPALARHRQMAAARGAPQ